MSKRTDQKIRQRLAKHATRMNELIAEGMDRDHASAQAYYELYRKTKPATGESETVSRRMTSKEFTRAVQIYARRHGHYAAFVRTNTTARREAIAAYAKDLGIICTGLTAPAYKA